MPLEKTEAVDRIEVVESGAVQIRTKTSILEDGRIISESFHRRVIAPGDDYSKESERVRAICAIVHAPEASSASKALASKGV